MESMWQLLPCTILDGVRQLRCDGCCYFFSSYSLLTRLLLSSRVLRLGVNYWPSAKSALGQYLGLGKQASSAQSMWLRVLLAVLSVLCVVLVSGGVACWAVELLVLKSNRYCCKLTLASLAIPPKSAYFAVFRSRNNYVSQG